MLFCIISPILFYYGTSVRGFVNEDTLSKLIIGRVSSVELAPIPIEAREKRDLYERKYGLINQLKRSINEVSPIDPFEYDVNPNQFHRAIFLENNELSVFDKYMSMNITLPVYFYLQTNFFWMYIEYNISFLYYIWVVNSNNLYLLIGIIMNLY